MPSATFDLRALPPVEAFRKFVEAVALAAASSPLDALVVGTNLHESQFSVAGGVGTKLPDRAKQIDETITKQSSFLTVRRLYTSIQSPDGSAAKKVALRYTSNDDITATFTIDIPDEEYFKAQVIPLSERFNSVYVFSRKSELIGQSLPQAEQDKLRYYERALSDLMAAVSKLGEVSTQQIERQATYLQQKSAELDAQFRQRLDENRKEHEARLADVAAGRAQLEKERSDFDVRKSTAVRRELLKDMKTLIETKFTLSDDTDSRQKVIHLFSQGAIFLGAACMLWGIGALLYLKPFDWHYLVIVWSGLLIGGSTLIFYLRWNGHWVSMLAKSEFDSRKLNVDVLRASWVTEMLLEWKDEKGDRPIPTELLTSFTTGLFMPTESAEKDHHPAGDATRLLAGITHLKANKDGLEISRT